MQGNFIDQNIIITESSKNLRTLGRNALTGKWKTAIIAMVIYTICLDLPPAVFDSLFGLKLSNLITSSGYTYGMDATLYSSMYNSMPNYCFLSCIYILLVAGALQLGQMLFFLAAFRKHDVKATDIFLGFEKFGKAFGLMIYECIFIMLWSFLFLIPGIIAAIRYSQAFFILADDPDKSITQCMNESKAMMRGNKMKYFSLSISFIGWYFLSALPGGILQSIGNMCTTNEFVASLLSLIGSLFMAPVIAYLLSSHTGFYEILAGHLIKETRPVPVTEQEARQLQMELEANTANEASTANEENGAIEANEVDESANALNAPSENVPVDPEGEVPSVPEEPAKEEERSSYAPPENKGSEDK